MTPGVEFVSFNVRDRPTPYRERAKVLRPKGRGRYLIVSDKDPETAAFQQVVATQAKAKMAGLPPIKGSVHLMLHYYFQVPRSWPKGKRTAACKGLIRPCVRPDLTNLTKCIEDALSKILFVDDAYVVDQTVKKFYALEPSVYIAVTRLGDHPNDADWRTLMEQANG